MWGCHIVWRLVLSFLSFSAICDKFSLVFFGSKSRNALSSYLSCFVFFFFFDTSFKSSA